MMKKVDNNIPTLYSETMNNYLAKKREEIKNCLSKCYKIDEQHGEKIISKLEPFIRDQKLHIYLDQFVKKSQELTAHLPLKQSQLLLNKDDALIAAPKWHELLVENDYFRILWVTTKQGDRETAHTHQWKGLMIVVSPANFKIYSKGKYIGEDDSPIGIYELNPETRKLSFENISSSNFEALLFEFKE